MKIINPNAPGRFQGTVEWFRINTPEDRFNLIGEEGEFLLCASTGDRWRWNGGDWQICGLERVGDTLVSSMPISAPLDVAVYTDFVSKSDGAIPLTHDETADAPIRVYYPPARGSVPLIVKDGRLQTATENADLTVAYTETDLGGNAAEIGADIGFLTRGGAASTIALCLWGDASLVDTFASGRIPTTGCHFIIGRDSWAYQIWEPNGSYTKLVTLKQGLCPALPTDGTMIRVRITFDGDHATFMLPDYSWKTEVQDSRIAMLGRRYACWETYQPASTADKPIYGRIWASCQKTAYAKSESDTRPWNRPLAVASATDGNKTITETTESAAAEIDPNTYIEFVMPSSGKVLLRYTAMFDQTVAGIVLLDLATVDAGGGNLGYKPVQISNTVSKGMRTACAVYSAPTIAGARRFFRPRAWVLSGAACTISRSVSGGLNPVLEVIPLP